jgi:hypothetical protein
VKTLCPPNRGDTQWPSEFPRAQPASHLAPGVARPIQQSRDGFLHEQRLTTVPPSLQCRLDPVVKQEVPFRVGEAERIELRLPDLVQLEVEDVSAAHAEEVRMDFAGRMISDLAVAGNGPPWCRPAPCSRLRSRARGTPCGARAPAATGGANATSGTT